MCGVAILPMVLGLHRSKAAVGSVMSLVGIGTLIGGAIMTATDGPKPRIYGVLGVGLLLSVCFVLIGIRPVGRPGGSGRPALVHRAADHERLQHGDLAEQDAGRRPGAGVRDAAR